MILEVKGVTKIFSQGLVQVEALKNISFQVDKSQSLAIVGPSGSGKTTLLTLLAGLDSPSSGEIIVSGVAIEQLNETELSEFRANNIGIIFQQYHLMPYLTALENISLPLDILGRKNSKEQAMEWLKKVGLQDRAHHLPDQLSGGESQRVALARACVVEPKFLLADEPSGSLDTETGKKVMDLLFQLVEETQSTLVLITHDMEIARRCNKQIQLLAGKLV